MTTNIEQAEENLAEAVRQELQIKRDRNEYLLELADDPKNQDLIHAIDSSDTDIAKHQRNKARWEDVIATLKKRNEKDFRQAEKKQKHQSGISQCVELEKCAKSLKEFEQLVPKLLKSLGDCSAHMQAAHGHKVDAGLYRLHEGFSDGLMTTAGAYLAKALNEAGFGERLGFVIARPAIGDIMGPAEAAQLVADKARAMVEARFDG